MRLARSWGQNWRVLMSYSLFLEIFASILATIASYFIIFGKSRSSWRGSAKLFVIVFSVGIFLFLNLFAYFNKRRLDDVIAERLGDGFCYLYTVEACPPEIREWDATRQAQRKKERAERLEAEAREKALAEAKALEEKAAQAKAEKIARDQDEASWKNADKLGTVEAYEAYQRGNPKGTHFREADQKITELRRTGADVAQRLEAKRQQELARQQYQTEIARLRPQFLELLTKVNAILTKYGACGEQKKLPRPRLDCDEHRTLTEEAAANSTHGPFRIYFVLRSPGQKTRSIFEYSILPGATPGGSSPILHANIWVDGKSGDPFSLSRMDSEMADIWRELFNLFNISMNDIQACINSGSMQVLGGTCSSKQAYQPFSSDPSFIRPANLYVWLNEKVMAK